MTDTLFFLFVLLSPMCVMRSCGDNQTVVPSAVTDVTAAAVMATGTIGPTNGSSSTPLPASDTALLVPHLHDSHANLRHHHHSHPWGPHFEENNALNVTVTEGESIRLDCRVGLIEDKLVSWVRRKSEQLDLLTLGTGNHSSDARTFSDFKYPNNWRLAILNASRSDSGTYLCQISTHPPKVLEVQLIVEAPEVFIVNSRGERITEVHYKEGSTLQLICSVNNVRSSRSVSWFRNQDLLNHDVIRGGVSIKTDMTADHAKSILHVALVGRKDAGTYLCSAPPQNATVTVHVLNGENPAELYRNEATMASLIWSWKSILLIFVLWVSGGSCSGSYSWIS